MEDLELTMVEMQKIGTDMLAEVAELCEKNNIRWFMAFGSALGAVRHKGPIPWDYDIDIYIPRCDLKKFLDIAEAVMSNKYWIDYRTNSKKKRTFPRIGLRGYETETLHIDIFYLQGFYSNPIMRFFSSVYSRFLYVCWKANSIDIDSSYSSKRKRIFVKIIKYLTFFIPRTFYITKLDKQASKIPFDYAEKVGFPGTRIKAVAYKKDLFDKSKLIEYSNFKVRVPENVEDYLELTYGNWRCYPNYEECEREMNRIFTVKVN